MVITRIPTTLVYITKNHICLYLYTHIFYSLQKWVSSLLIILNNFTDQQICFKNIVFKEYPKNET